MRFNKEDWKKRMFDSKAAVRQVQRYEAYCELCPWSSVAFTEPEVAEYSVQEHMKRMHAEGNN